jgi:hypothetical protein
VHLLRIKLNPLNVSNVHGYHCDWKYCKQLTFCIVHIDDKLHSCRVLLLQQTMKPRRNPKFTSPPLVMARRTLSLLRTLCNIEAFLNTDIVDCESNKIQFGSIPDSLLV